MCTPVRQTPSDHDVKMFLNDHGYDENITPKIAREIAADWMKCFPSSGVRAGTPSRKFEEEGITFRPGQKQALTDYIYPTPTDSS